MKKNVKNYAKKRGHTRLSNPNRFFKKMVMVNLQLNGY